MLDRIPERLRQSAEGVAAATKLMADAKSQRNRAAGDEGSCYQGVKVEQTAEWQGDALIDRYEVALTKINAIRNSIIGAQTMNWSEHIYPLVAALEEAGISGQHYPEAREYVGSLVERAVKAETALQEIEAMPFSMTNDSESLRHTIKQMQQIARAATK